MEYLNEKRIMIKTVDKKEIIINGNYTNIGELMSKLETEHSYRRDCQQIIYSGNILKENDNIPEMTEKSFLVLLMKKPKVTVETYKEVEEQNTKVTTGEKMMEEVVKETNQDNETVKEGIKEVEKTDNNEKDEVSIPENPLNNIEPNLEMVENLMTMGFDISDIKMILAATNNNMEMTGAILMEPAMLEEIKTKLAKGENPFENPMNNSNNGGGHPGELTEEQVMEMMEQNPQAFQQLLAKIVEQQPEIANLVQSDPQTFISLLTKFLNQSGMVTNRGMEPGHHTDMGGMPESSQQPQIEMSQEEKTLIESLQPMFPHLPTITILETLRACGNNEEMTANLLFEY